MKLWIHVLRTKGDLPCLRNGVLPESESSSSAFLQAQVQAGVRDDEQSRLMFEIRSVV